MKNNKRYGIQEFQVDFGTEAKVLKAIFEANHSYICSCGGRYVPLKGRRQYQCSKCRFQIAPTAGTIFHKSDTALTSWFFAIFLFANAKSGYSAKQLQRDLNVTYKTAWRMLNLVRSALPQGTELLKGDVEVDETYLGGKGHSGPKKRKEMLAKKTQVIGAVERDGKIRTQIVNDTKSYSIMRFLEANVKGTATLYTDTKEAYKWAGYKHESVNHSKREFARGKAYVNTLEGFWSHVKRSINGTHKVISKKHLPSYLDAFVWHWNNRSNDRERFSFLLGALLPASQ